MKYENHISKIRERMVLIMNKDNKEIDKSLEICCMGIGSVMAFIAIFIILVLLASLIVGRVVLTIIGITLLCVGIILMKISKYIGNS